MALGPRGRGTRSMGGRRAPLSRWSHLMQRVWWGGGGGRSATTGCGGTGSPTQRVVRGHGALTVDGSPKWHGPAGWGDESHSTGGYSPRCACGEGQPAVDRTHMRGERGVPSSRWSQLRKRPRRTVAPGGAGTWPMGTWSPIQPVGAAHGALAGKGSPLWHRPTGKGDSESHPVGGRNSWSACGGGQTPMAGPRAWGVLDRESHPCALC